MTKRKSIRASIRALSEKIIDDETDDDDLFDIPTFIPTPSTDRSSFQDSLFTNTPSCSSTPVMNSTQEKVFWKF